MQRRRTFRIVTSRQQCASQHCVVDAACCRLRDTDEVHRPPLVNGRRIPPVSSSQKTKVDLGGDVRRRERTLEVGQRLCRVVCDKHHRLVQLDQHLQHCIRTTCWRERERKDQKEVSTECACVVGWCGFVQNVNEPLNHVVATPDDTIAIKNKRIDHPKQLFPAGNPH